MNNGHQPKEAIKSNPPNTTSSVQKPNPCTKCDLYEDGLCRKWRLEGSKPKPFERDIFSSPDEADIKEFIPIEKACRRSSIYGYNIIGLTDEDIERLKNGEVVHVSGEYSTFVGYVPKKKSTEEGK